MKNSNYGHEQFYLNGKFIPIMAIFACLLWGSAFPVIKISYEELNIASEDIFSKTLFAGYRFLLASLFLVFWRLLSKGNKSMRMEKKYLPFLTGLGLMQTTLQYTFFYIGLANTTGVKGSILTTLGTFLL